MQKHDWFWVRPSAVSLAVRASCCCSFFDLVPIILLTLPFYRVFHFLVPFIPQIYDRQGNQQCEFVKGYPYVMELKQCKGHKSGCTGGSWHPGEDNIVLTASTDGSLRQWDINHPEQSLDTIKINKTASGKRMLVTACAYSSTGNLLAGAGIDGGIQVVLPLRSLCGYVCACVCVCVCVW
jgi:WD40 repeat protein